MALPLNETAGADKRMLKQKIQQMSRALRDSEGGSLIGRFEAVSKLLFTKMVDEREVEGTWGPTKKESAEFCFRALDTERLVYERARAIWHRVVAAFPSVFAGSRAEFPEDVLGVAKIASILQPIDLTRIPADVKGDAYEEILRNTFEKNENQQYFTPRHIVDFVVGLCDPEPGDKACDPAAGSGGFLVAVLNHFARKTAILDGAVTGLRGAEVDELMAWVARINLLMHGGDPACVHHLPGAGSLAPLATLRQALPHDSFDLIVTNPPFGSDLTDRSALALLSTGKGRTSRRRGILFVERCLQLLRPGGRLAIILDDSVLNLSSNSDIQQFVRRHSVVEAVISLPDVTFMPYSTAKSSVLLVRRRVSPAEPQGPVFMADVENVGNRPNGDPLYSDARNEAGQRQLKSDLPWVLDAYDQVRKGAWVEQRRDGTVVFVADIDEYRGGPEDSRLDVFYFHPARRHAQERLSASRYTLCAIGDLVQLRSLSVNPAIEYGDTSIRWIGLGDIESNTGEYETREVPGERIRSNAHLFKSGDVLFSRLRPKLRKSVLIPESEEDGVCSSELLVLRKRGEDGKRVLKPFLSYLLRSDLVYGQLIYQVTGVGRPRVSASAVLRVKVPLPPYQIQRRLVDELRRAHQKSNALRATAGQQLELATRETDLAFEHVLRELCPGQLVSISSGVGVGVAARPARRTASA